MQDLNLQEIHQVAGGEGYVVDVMVEVPLSYVLAVVELLHNVTSITFVDITELEQAISSAGIIPSQITAQVNVMYTTFA